MTSKELYDNKADPSAILKRARKEMTAGRLTSEEYTGLKKEVLSKEYEEWREERLVE